jgi:hypothetical protein
MSMNSIGVQCLLYLILNIGVSCAHYRRSRTAPVACYWHCRGDPSFWLDNVDCAEVSVVEYYEGS